VDERGGGGPLVAAEEAEEEEVVAEEGDDISATTSLDGLGRGRGGREHGARAWDASVGRGDAEVPPRQPAFVFLFSTPRRGLGACFLC
jgi:hypothetical protein